MSEPSQDQGHSGQSSAGDFPASSLDEVAALLAERRTRNRAPEADAQDASMRPRHKCRGNQPPRRHQQRHGLTSWIASASDHSPPGECTSVSNLAISQHKLLIVKELWQCERSPAPRVPQ